MYENIFSVLMVIALGTMAGCGFGLLIGFALGKQKAEWSEMTPGEKRFNIVLVIICTIVAIAGLGWYSLLR